MQKEQRDLLVFGYGLGIISAVFGVGGGLKHGWHLAPVVLLVCSVVFTGVTALDWQALRPGYAGWMKVAHGIGMVVTTVVLSVVFFAVFTPVAILLKLLGKDHMERRWNRTAQSYWHMRPAGTTDKARYYQQF